MTAQHATDIINGYLARLDAEAADLPRMERQELLDGVREHIAEARAEMQDENDADLLNLLDRLGTPAELAAEERERLGLAEPEPVRVGTRDVAAIVLTAFVWPIGLILLWSSRAWNVRDKLIGTLVPPGGLFTSWLVLSALLLWPRSQTCTSSGNAAGQVTCTGVSGSEAVLLGILVLIAVSPIVTAIYLGLRLRQHSRFHAISAIA